MKKFLKFLIIGAIVLFSFACNQSASNLGFQAVASDSEARNITLTNGTVTSYSLKFYKIEIGNSETDKYTVWESETGEAKDLANSPTFDVSSATVPIGTYQFCRVIVGDTLSITGTITPGGSGSATLTLAGNYTSQTEGLETGQVAFLFGTADVNNTGQYVLTSTIEVADGTVLSMNFDLANTISYSSGLAVTAPTLTFTATVAK